MVHATQTDSPSSSVTVDISLRLGIDLAKNVFELVQVKDRSTVVFNKRLNREQLTALVMKLPPQRIVMEACATSTWWAQKFTAMQHEVLLIAPQHVRAYRQGQKNDRNDAHAIIEASFNPKFNPVPIRSPYQQELAALNNHRDRIKGERTRLANQMRACLGEFGIVVPKSLHKLRAAVPTLIESAVPQALKALLQTQYEALCQQDVALKEATLMITTHLANDARSEQLMAQRGIGPQIAAGVLAHCCPQAYQNGRGYAAVVGITPGQDSSGETRRLLPITKSGSRRVRTLLIHGGRSVVRIAERHPEDPLCVWAKQIADRRGKNVAAVAVANKLARYAWAILAHAA